MGAIEGSGLKLLVPLNGIAMEIRQGQPPCRPFTLIHAIYQNLSTRRVNVKVVIGHAIDGGEHPRGKNHDRGRFLNERIKKRSLYELRLLWRTVGIQTIPAHRGTFGMKTQHLKHTLRNLHWRFASHNFRTTC